MEQKTEISDLCYSSVVRILDVARKRFSIHIVLFFSTKHFFANNLLSAGGQKNYG
jgi:hypothetical protein